ncbi:putative Lipid A 3-O-deacylase-related protein [uncultured Desulfobacterium sp.]|uniref:Putative Lipid A 3-O-deacylase-related protein n=1 Tax=uncultured Desulfobacterium sp. TaxID=201089 RepID=A0A445N1H3_9BACT|nr:putative Lipid A 3-O-deacylase-related protein [uncultured Desulfobacterium sp.]
MRTFKLFMIAPLVLLFFGFTEPIPCYAGEAQDYKLGVKLGLNAMKHDEIFRLYEVYMVSGLPWTKHWHSGWIGYTGLSFNAGIQRAADDSGLVASMGPVFSLTKRDSRIFLIFSFRFALMDDYQFGHEDLGGRFAFIEECGFRYYLGWNMYAGYQYRHMSNAHIYDKNPGVDMHTLELIYNF